MTSINRILRIDSSARKTGSVTRSLADETLNRLAELTPVNIVDRDVSSGLPFVDEAWVNANFTPSEARTAADRAKLAFSDDLVEELATADTVVISTPIYNFGVPATLKAWIDMIARAGVTFRYTENGPVGLLEGKRAIILVASGGTPVGSPVDFATPYLKQALAFVGITDVSVIASDAMNQDTKAKRQDASNQIKALKAA
ncbi:NAD(P)H-dependent oxidoreductase [Sphingorhabdus sp. Alg231-15]|uniref:NAD(P)H-dependent oxidoreductase n=1 Tax=Sphingorhabdus sp. Alg231-15 TaxID=1922222 RepID=UPI000D55C26F